MPPPRLTFADIKNKSISSVMESTETKEVKKGREAALERLRAKYPDREFADDDAIFDQIGADYDDFDKELAAYRDREKKLNDMFAADPRSARMVVDWAEGTDPAVSLVRQFGIEVKDLLDDPEWQDKLAEANKEYVERVAENQRLEEEYNANFAASMENLNLLQQERGLSDDEVDNAMAMLLNISHDAILGKFSTESIDMALKALHHDEDVAAANYEGEVKGRNTKIEEKLRKRGQGDGTAQLAGSKSTAAPVRKERSSIFGMAELAR